MQILPSSRSLTQPLGPFALGLGIFDGVHLGHQTLLQEVCRLARQDQVSSLAYTFDPHPARVIAPVKTPPLIEPVECRLEAFSALGLNATLIERFDSELGRMPAETFVSEVLVKKLRARHVVVGKGFCFGYGGRGNTELLQQMGPAHGFAAHIIPPVIRDSAIVSSTRIRHYIAHGEMEMVQALLGRPFALTGTVARGMMRGQTLGFPTANLQPDNEIMPATGVYAGRVSGPIGTHPAVVNIGFTPTFGSETLKVEAHLLDFPSQPLYGMLLSVQLVERLRAEQKFAGPSELVAQIERDIARARQRLDAPTAPVGSGALCAAPA